jgi:hypothetical protein
MKSSYSQLKSRGRITIEDLKYYNNLTKLELLEMITSKEAYKRTIAVKFLLENHDLNDDLIHLFLHTLIIEKKLYTKIELCDALSKGGSRSAEIMVEYLGQIGNNQHKKLPMNDFNKKSYPLPRDIIARTLAHMNVEILPVLLNVLKPNDNSAIREVIDAIGFICFYQKVPSNTEIIDALLLCLKHNYNDDLIRWKLVRAFGSFNDINVIKTLIDIEQNDSQSIIRNEAKRSLRVIRRSTQS